MPWQKDAQVAALAARGAPLVCPRAVSAAFTGMALWEAQPCQHSRPLCVAFTAAMVMLRCTCRETESQEMQGLSWKQGNHLGSQWGQGEFDLWSKSGHAFTLFVISVPLFFALLAQIILWVCVFVLGRNGKFYSIRKGLENMVTIFLFPTGI